MASSPCCCSIWIVLLILQHGERIREEGGMGVSMEEADCKNARYNVWWEGAGMAALASEKLNALQLT